MHYPKYTELTASKEYDIFEFVSFGPKGKIIKRIQFSKTQLEGVYNLGFGDKLDDATIDDTVDSKNGDRDKVLATVVGVVYEYTSVYPERAILFFGSSSARTRLYRMAIGKNYEELSKDFHIFVLVEQGNEIVQAVFDTCKDCLGFLIKRKRL